MNFHIFTNLMYMHNGLLQNIYYSLTTVTFVSMYEPWLVRECKALQENL
jgi:hypothetical protein